jgi:hypothetical protein
VGSLGIRQTRKSFSLLALRRRDRLSFCALAGAVFLGCFFLSSAPLQAQVPEMEPGILLPGEARARALEDLAALDRCREPGPRVSPALLLQQLRSQYLLAVDSREALEPAQTLLAALARTSWASSPDGRPLVQGYRGALLALEARHGFWPSSRIRDLREGFRLLDAQIAAAPNHVEVRYLRLMSAAFLPGIFGRGEIVQEDLEMLARQLPRSSNSLPERTWTLMADAVQALLLDRRPTLGRQVAPDFQRSRSSARVAAIPLLPTGCPASDS